MFKLINLYAENHPTLYPFILSILTLILSNINFIYYLFSGRYKIRASSIQEIKQLCEQVGLLIKSNTESDTEHQIEICLKNIEGGAKKLSRRTTKKINLNTLAIRKEFSKTSFTEYLLTKTLSQESSESLKKTRESLEDIITTINKLSR